MGHQQPIYGPQEDEGGSGVQHERCVTALVLWCDWSVALCFLTLSCVCLKRISPIQGILIKRTGAVVKMYGGVTLEIFSLEIHSSYPCR